MQLINWTYSQKESYLIDVIWYDKSELEQVGELGLDELIKDSKKESDYLEYIQCSIHCNNCNKNFIDDTRLESIPNEWYHCPTCHTDWYLVDIK